MSDTTTGFGSYDPGANIRPLSVRMTEDVRAQLDIIAQLNNRSVTEEVRVGLEDWILRSKSDPKVLERAAAVKAEIEREAATKRGAIAAIFDEAPKAKLTKDTSPSPARPAKSAGE
jgi:hypothetical protein